MQSIAQIISLLPEKFNQVVLAGAGSGNEYDALNAKGFEQLIMLEVDNARCQALSHALADDNRVTIINNALSATEGEQKLTRYDNPDLNSLAEADQLTSFYPGIQESSKETIECVTLQNLNRQFDISAKENNLLILDIQGFEGLIFTDTPESELNKYRVFIIRTSKENLYKIEPNGFIEAVNFFKKHQLDCLIFPESIPPYVNIIAFRSTALQLIRENNQQLIKESEKLTESLNILERKLHEANFTLEQTTQNLSNKLASVKSDKHELNKRNKKLEQKIKREQKNLVDLNHRLKQQEAGTHTIEEQFRQLQKELADLHQTNNTLTEQLSIANAERDNLSQENRELKQNIIQQQQSLADSNHALQQQETSANTLEKQFQQLKNEMADVRNEKADLQHHLERQQQSAQLSTKLLAKAEADASDLRERYAEKVSSEQDLRDLIKELHSKLEAASRFYHQLEEEHPELLEKL